jgi:beta-glucosidase-like glycosyl hydrolase
VISDWLGIDRITSPPGANYTYSVQAGINAGIDMVCGSLLRKLFLTYMFAAA